MGFFKNIMNKITGHGAKVSVEVFEPNLDEPFQVKVTAIISDADMKIDKVYLRIRSLESTTVRGVDVWEGDDHRFIDVNGQEEIFGTEYVVTGATVLKANETYEWTTEVQLPEGSLPSYYGRNAEHVWQFYAGLDTPGNDPDSGWVVYDVY